MYYLINESQNCVCTYRISLEKQIVPVGTYSTAYFKKLFLFLSLFIPTKAGL